MQCNYNFVSNQTLNLVGVAVKEGQDLEGTEIAPSYLRQANLVKVIEELGWDVIDHGDITNSDIRHGPADGTLYKRGDVKNASEIGQVCKKLHDITEKSSKSGAFTLVLGGDHGIATGSISGLKTANPDLKVVWVDAHGDCNTPDTSGSGNYHGMPVAHLLGWIPEGTLPGFDWFKPVLHPEDIVYVGLRDLDASERCKLAEENIKMYDMDDVTEKGIGRIVAEIIDYFNQDGKVHPIHISFDIDAIDPIYAPHTGTKARGGLTDREAHLLIRKLAKTKQVSSMDLVEINPRLDNDILRLVLHGDNKLIQGSETVCLGIELILSALGNTLTAPRQNLRN
jgi:arginase